MSTPRKPDLDQLISALTADGRPDELVARDAAVDAFRAAGWRGTADQAGQRSGTRFRRPLTALTAPMTTLSGRLAAVGDTLAVAAAGLTAAAYAQALPGPVQQLAHTVFAPLGVPNQQPGQPLQGTGTAGVTTATSGARPGRITPGGTAKAPSPRPGDGYLITVAVSRARVPAGGRVSFTGQVTDHGLASARVRVRLFERLAGSSTRFELMATGMTGPLGGFRLPSPPLTATAVFRVVGPDGAHSVAVRVAVGSTSVTAPATGLPPGPVPTGR